MRITNKILEILPEANPLYSVLFIYAKANEEEVICPKEYAQTFNISEEEVIGAFQYFQLKRFIHLRIEENLYIEFIENESREKLVLIKPQLVEEGAEEKSAEYTPEEIAYYQGFDEVKSIFDIAENTLGTLLNPLQQSAVLSLYESYRFTKEVIEEILHYAVKESRTRADSICEIAKNWDDIKVKSTTEEDIQEIIKALGVSKRDITPKLTSKIEAWQKEHSTEMILEACDRTIMKFAKPNLVYTEAILNDWHKKGIKTIAEMLKDNESHSNKLKEKSNSNKVSKFNNFERNNKYKVDYDKIIKELQDTY